MPGTTRIPILEHRVPEGRSRAQIENKQQVALLGRLARRSKKHQKRGATDGNQLKNTAHEKISKRGYKGLIDVTSAHTAADETNVKTMIIKINRTAEMQFSNLQWLP